MSRYSLSHLASEALLPALHEKVALGRRGTAEVLALIAEIEKRRLYLSVACSSMYEYCVRRLGFSEDEASRRVQSARAARRFPIIFEMIADGRLHMTGVRLLRRHLTPSTVNGLLRASIHKTRAEIEQQLAERFLRPGMPTQVLALAAPAEQSSGNGTQPVANTVGCSELPAPERVSLPDNPGLAGAEASPISNETTAAPAPPPRPRVTPLGAERYGLQVELRKVTHDKLRRLQELLGHRVPAGDLDAVLEHAFDAAISQIEKRKLGATDRPRRARPSRDPRHIPARVKRAVRERDQDRCAFVGDNGKRCDARHGLEFDHVIPVARGGESTVANVRQLCRAHNQYVAEREFGQDFMNGKRQAAVAIGMRAALKDRRPA